MTKLVYTGSITEPQELEDGQVVRRGETVDVDSDLAERLLEQTELDPDAEPVDGEPLARRPVWARPTTKVAQTAQRAAKRTSKSTDPDESPEARIDAGSPAITPPDQTEES